MGLFRKKDKVIDLTEHYKKQQEKLGDMKSEAKQTQTNSGSFFGGFFGGADAGTSGIERERGIGGSGSIEERRRRLAKRFKEMSDRLEDLSNQIYHLQQRIELLERKANVHQ